MEDSGIIALYFARDEAAITETDIKYGDYCRTIARNILLSGPDAQECVNDTWLRTWNTIPPTRPKALRSFLAKITRNLSFDRYRAERAQKRGGGQALLPLEELKECVPGGNPADQAELEALKASIGKFLQDLPSRERNIFLRRYFYGEDFGIIANRYCMRDSNVRNILSRIRKKLAQYLREEGFEV